VVVLRQRTEQDGMSDQQREEAARQIARKAAGG
jgi:hypothetical protein